jgi:hypothetical protein
MPVDKGAVANTDQELLAAAFEAEEPDFDNTDRSLEEMGDGPEGQHMPEDEEVEEAAAPEGDGPKKPGDEPEEPAEVEEPGDEPEEQTEPEEPRDARGLRAAMLSERKQRQAAEAASKAAREEIAAANARIDRILAQQQPQQQQPPPPAPAKPDPVLDPDGYERYVVAQMEQRYTMRRIEETFQETHETVGKEFEAAYESLRKLDANNPVDRAIGNRIYTSPNPGKALMRWHREQTMLQEMGSDPAAYRQKLRDELLNDPDMVKAVLARVREQRDGNGQQPGAPRNVTRLPPSLNRARGGSTSNELLGAADNTDEAIFNYAMNGNG